VPPGLPRVFFRAVDQHHQRQQLALSRRPVRTLVHDDPALVQPPAKRLPAQLRILGQPRLQVRWPAPSPPRCSADGAGTWLAVPDILDNEDIESFGYSNAKKALRYHDTLLPDLLATILLDQDLVSHGDSYDKVEVCDPSVSTSASCT